MLVVVVAIVVAVCSSSSSSSSTPSSSSSSRKPSTVPTSSSTWLLRIVVFFVDIVVCERFGRAHCCIRITIVLGAGERVSIMSSIQKVSIWDVQSCTGWRPRFYHEFDSEKYRFRTSRAVEGGEPVFIMSSIKTRIDLGPPELWRLESSFLS